MEGSRSWSVESKAFEMMIKGGALGVRIVEISNNRRRSIFIQRDELAWLVDAVEVAVDKETPEVFWDQARAGYPRLLTQKCSNRHGRFVTIKEFEGRRRIGNILIPEGRYGQGWARLMSELQMMSLSLWKGSEIRKKKVENMVSASRSFVDVVGLAKSPELVPASQSGGSDMIPAKANFQTVMKQPLVEPGGCFKLVEGMSGEQEGSPAVNQWAQAPLLTGKFTVGVPLPKEASMRCEEGALMAIQELGSCRAWLRRLKGEIAAGLRRVDAAIRVLESPGPGQGRNGSGGPCKSLNRFEPKQRYRLKTLEEGVGPGGGPKTFKPKECTLKSMTEGAGTSAGLGLLERPEELQGLPGPGLGCVGLPRGGDSGPGSFSPQGKKRLSCDQLLSSEIGDSTSAKPVTERMQGEVQSSADLLQAACCRRSDAVWGEREGLRTQISPMKGTSLGSHRKTRGLSEGTSIGGVGILSRPKYSWVAGRTGFGPIYSGKTMGLSFSDSVVAPSSNELLTGLSPAVPAVPNSVGFSLPDTVSPVGNEKIDGVDSMILCSLLGNGLQDEVVSKNGLEESFVEDLAAESGNELRSLGSLGEFFFFFLISNVVFIKKH
jgi:hypothetical protein